MGAAGLIVDSVCLDAGLPCLYLLFVACSVCVLQYTASMAWRGPAPPYYPDNTHSALDRSRLDEILPQLYLTNFKGADNMDELRRLKCTHIVSVGEEFVDDPKKAGITFWRLNISDDDDQSEKMSKALRGAAMFLHKALQKKGCAVVHCAAGISRSATVVLGYLVIYKKMTLRDAFGLVHGKRPCIWPNDGFMSALIKLEKKIQGNASNKGVSSITMDEYIRWGDWEGPEEEEEEQKQEKEAANSEAPALRGRLMRRETNLHIEKRELDALAALANGERKAAIIIQGAVRKWMLAVYARKKPEQVRRSSSIVLDREMRKRMSLAATREALQSRAAMRKTQSSDELSSARLKRRPSMAQRMTSLGSGAVGSLFKRLTPKRLDRGSGRLTTRAPPPVRTSTSKVVPG